MTQPNLDGVPGAAKTARPPLQRALLLAISIGAVVYGVMQIRTAFSEGSGPVPREAIAAALGATNFVPFVDATHGISLQYPNTWQLQQLTAGPTILNLKTLRGVVNMNIGYAAHSPGRSLASLVEENVEAIKTLSREKNITVVFVERSTGMLGNVPASRLMFRYKMQGQSMLVRTSQVYAIRNDHAYVFTFTAPEEMQNQFAGVQQQILASVRLK